MENEIGNRLCMLRKKHGYSQIELADKLEVSRQAISRWELGESYPTSNNIICLAKLYNISLDELILGQKNAIVVDEKKKSKVHSKKVKKPKKEKEVIEYLDIKYSIKDYFKMRSAKFYLLLISCVLGIIAAIMYWVGYTQQEILKEYFSNGVPLILLIVSLLVPVALMIDDVGNFMGHVLFVMTTIAFGLNINTAYMYLTTVFYDGVSMAALKLVEPGFIGPLVCMVLMLILSFICICFTSVRRKVVKTNEK